MGGHTLIELTAVLSMLLVLLAASVPALTSAAAEGRTRGAAFYMASRITLLRMMAVQRTANVALRFEHEAGTWHFRPFADGDWDGVRSADIVEGRDYPVGVTERIEVGFSGVTFGFADGCPLIDGDAVPSDALPVRFGSARMISFSPAGTATSGTLYVKGRGLNAYAVVVLGATGRTRVLRCGPPGYSWSEHGR